MDGIPDGRESTEEGVYMCVCAHAHCEREAKRLPRIDPLKQTKRGPEASPFRLASALANETVRFPEANVHL